MTLGLSTNMASFNRFVISCTIQYPGSLVQHETYLGSDYKFQDGGQNGGRETL